MTKPPQHLFLCRRAGTDTEEPCGAVYAPTSRDAAEKFARPSTIVARRVSEAPMQDFAAPASGRIFRELRDY